MAFSELILLQSCQLLPAHRASSLPQAAQTGVRGFGGIRNLLNATESPISISRMSDNIDLYISRIETRDKFHLRDSPLLLACSCVGSKLRSPYIPCACDSSNMLLKRGKAFVTHRTSAS